MVDESFFGSHGGAGRTATDVTGSCSELPEKNNFDPIRGGNGTGDARLARKSGMHGGMAGKACLTPTSSACSMVSRIRGVARTRGKLSQNSILVSRFYLVGTLPG